MTTRRALFRGAARALTIAFVATLALAGPASAVPEGWSDPDPVSGLAALSVLLFAPLAVIAVTVTLALAPRWASAAKATPALGAAEPTTGLDELLAPDAPAELESSDEK